MWVCVGVPMAVCVCQSISVTMGHAGAFSELSSYLGASPGPVGVQTASFLEVLPS